VLGKRPRSLGQDERRGGGVFSESDAVIGAVLHIQVRSHSGVELDLDQAWAYWIRNGKIWRIEQHGSKQEALEAVGRSE